MMTRVVNVTANVISRFISCTLMGLHGRNWFRMFSISYKDCKHNCKFNTELKMMQPRVCSVVCVCVCCQRGMFKDPRGRLVWCVWLLLCSTLCLLCMSIGRCVTADSVCLHPQGSTRQEGPQWQRRLSELAGHRPATHRQWNWGHWDVGWGCGRPAEGPYQSLWLRRRRRRSFSQNGLKKMF